MAVCLFTRARARLDELALRVAPLAGADAAAQCAEEGGDGAAAAGHHQRCLLADGTEVKIVTRAIPLAMLPTVDCLQGGECVAGGWYDSGDITRPACTR